ncbi:hypothetical protein JKP88DRAFT_315537 [Tribonema minus]|uniref:Uncharacterized protein n=1 Tax=Tribonema minus TaxID=303371 RepID=A0A836CG11_9STRA|nr:hypothetical protein JKP88DRAFT_315537 [Tribonema minus]
MLNDIVGKNLAARASKHVYGRAQTHFTTLVPSCTPENMEVAMAEEARIKALAVPTRPVGETFDFEESTIESEISWVRTTKFSTKLILTNVVDPATGKKKALYCTPRPTPSSQQEVIFNYTRWADVTSYGLVPGKTILNDGGVFVDTNGQHFVVRYGDSTGRNLPARLTVLLPPPPRPPLAPAPAPLAPLPPPASSAPKYNLVTEMPDPTEFTSDFSQYRIFFAKDDRWHIGNITSCTISTGRTAAFWVEVSVNMKQIASTARMDLLEEPEAFSFRVLHSQYLGSGELKHRASGNWFLKEVLSRPAPPAPRTTAPATSPAAPNAPAAPAAPPAAPPAPPTARTALPAAAAPTGTEEYGLSHILSEARPGQGVTSLEDAWSTFLLQRAVIMFNGVLIFHDYTTDPSRTKKTGKRIDTINYKKNGIMKLRRYNGGGQSEEEMQEESAGGEEGGADEEDVEDEGDSEDSDDSDGEGEEEEESGDGAESEGDEDWAEAGRGDIGGGYVSIAPGARTGGIMQAIVDSVTVRQLLPPSGFCLYSNAVRDMEYGQLAWPSLSWDVVNSCRLMWSPELTIGNASDIPVNNCIKILSLAAAIGRPPTCTAGCTLLTPAEVQLVLKRCKGAARVDDPGHARTPKPPITLRGALPASLAHLVWDYDLKTRREVVDSWTLVRAEVACKAADVGVREEQYTATSINNIKCAARYLFHTATYFNTTAEAGEHLSGYFAVLHKQQVSYQLFWRNQLAAEHSANITSNVKLRKGRLVDTATWEYVNDRMIGVMVEGTWGPFQGAIDKWLKDNGKSWADLDGLGNILVNVGESDNFGTNRGKKPDASHLTDVGWVQELAGYLRETVKVNLYDCCNLELLTHLLAYMEKPVRQQDVWHNRASLIFAKIINGEMRLFLTIDSPANKKSMGKGKGRAGNLNDPLPTSIPLPKELTRMFLVSLFVCRTMRLQVQQSESTKAADRAKPVPDFVIGLCGNSNKRMGKKTFTNILTKLGMCHFALARWGPYSIRNQWVSDMFMQAHNIEVDMGRGAAQEYLANAMKDIHSSLDAAITHYNQTLRIQYASCLRPSKYQRVNDGYGTEATASASESVSSGGGSSGGGISSWGADTYGGGAHAMPLGKDMLILQQRQTAAMEQMAAATAAAQATSAATQATLAAVLAHIQGKQDKTDAASAPSTTAAPSHAASPSIAAPLSSAAPPFTKAAAPTMPPQQVAQAPPPVQYMQAQPPPQYMQLALPHQYMQMMLHQQYIQMAFWQQAFMPQAHVHQLGNAQPMRRTISVSPHALPRSVQNGPPGLYFTGLEHMGNNTNRP